MCKDTKDGEIAFISKKKTTKFITPPQLFAKAKISAVPHILIPRRPTSYTTYIASSYRCLWWPVDVVSTHVCLCCTL